MNDLEKKKEVWKGIKMTDRVTKEDLDPRVFNGSEVEAARITALGLLAIAQAIDGFTKQVKRVIDTEMPPEQPELTIVPDDE